ncbi:hypothetical protein I4U23_004099 [Adineta vaga]|nr:hypothetical protein I4U23_004099 [Adineta vaga]
MSSDLENDEIIILNPIAKAINNPFSENISSTKANQVIGSIEDEYKARNDADIEINHVTTPEKKKSLYWLVLLFVTNRVFLSCIFTSIAMIVGIIVVYYTIPQPPSMFNLVFIHKKE